MGMQTMQAQQPMQGGGKGSMIQPQQQGMGNIMGPMTMDMPQQPMPQDMGRGMGQQPRFGQPNRYSNTTQQPWDNANINSQPGGKGAGGKGAGMQQGGQMQGGGKGQAGGGYPTAPTNFGQPTQTAAYPTAQTNFGQGTPLTQPTAPVTNTVGVGQVDDYSAAGAGGQGA